MRNSVTLESEQIRVPSILNEIVVYMRIAFRNTRITLLQTMKIFWISTFILMSQFSNSQNNNLDLFPPVSNDYNLKNTYRKQITEMQYFLVEAFDVGGKHNLKKHDPRELLIESYQNDGFINLADVDSFERQKILNKSPNSVPCIQASIKESALKYSCAVLKIEETNIHKEPFFYTSDSPSNPPFGI